MNANHAHTPTIPTTEIVEEHFVYYEFEHMNFSPEVSRARFRVWLEEIEAAAEQRGAVKALREAAKDWRWSAWADAPRNPIAAANYTGDWIESRADRIADKEGDDEYSTEG